MNAPIRAHSMKILLAIAIVSSFPACNCGEDPTGGDKDTGTGPDLGSKDVSIDTGTPDDTGTDGGNPNDTGGDAGDTDGAVADTGIDAGTDPNNPNNDRRDTDCDGLSDAREFSTVYPGGAQTDPGDPDSDDDGILDGIEYGVTSSVAGSGCPPLADADPNENTSPVDEDTDDDGLLDGEEDLNGNGAVDAGETNPRLRDTDGDGIPDGVEDANQNGARDPGETNPTLRDTDGDGLGDGVEDSNRNGVFDAGETDPRNPDTDGDGRSDGTEDQNHDGQTQATETNPRDSDSDCDGLSDGDEIATFGTSPLIADSDGDGINDGVEAGRTTIPIAGSACAAGQPTDQDPGTTTMPANPDSDGDGLPDGIEDANQNGRVDPGETDPNDDDTDGDGLSDGDEVLLGFDPTNPNDPPPGTGGGINLICDDSNLKVVDFNIGGTTWTLATEQSIAYLPITVTSPGSNVEAAALDDTMNQVAGFILRMPLLSGAASSAAQSSALDARWLAAGAGENVSLVGRISARNIVSHDGFETAVSGVFDATLTSGAANASVLRNRLIRMTTNLASGAFTGLPSNTGGTDTAYVVSYQVLVRTQPQELIVIAAVVRASFYDSITDNRSILLSDLTNGTALALAEARRDKDCDPFEAEGQAIADFIWMADISGSTDDDRGRIVTAATQVTNALTSNGVDYRMGVVPHINSTLNPPGGAAVTPGQLRGGFVRSTAVFASHLQDTTNSDGCEFGLRAASDAINFALPRSAPGVEVSDKLRDNSTLAVVYISDEHAQEVTEGQCSHDPGNACDTGIRDYYSTGPDNNVCSVTLNAAQLACVGGIVQPYITQIQNEGGIAFAQVIIPNATPTVCTGYACPAGQPANEPGIGYVEVVNATGGAMYSPCVDNPGNALQAIVDAVTGAASQFQLSGNPISSTIKVGVIRVGAGGNGTTDIAPRDKDDGFDYDPVSNSIFFRGFTYRPNQDDVVIVSYRLWLPPIPPCGGPCAPGQLCDPQLGICTCDQALCTQNCGPLETCDASCNCACAPDCNGQCAGGEVCNATTCACECPSDCGGCPAGTVCNPGTCTCDCDTNCGGACAGTPLECNPAACNCQCPADCGTSCAPGTVCNTSLCACTCDPSCDAACPGNASCDPTQNCACICPTDCGGCPDNTVCNATSCACECAPACDTQCQNREVCDPNNSCSCVCPTDCGGCAANETCDPVECRCIPIV
jgi:hypothetical protein